MRVHPPSAWRPRCPLLRWLVAARGLLHQKRLIEHLAMIHGRPGRHVHVGRDRCEQLCRVSSPIQTAGIQEKEFYRPLSLRSHLVDVCQGSVFRQGSVLATPPLSRSDPTRARLLVNPRVSQVSSAAERFVVPSQVRRRHHPGDARLVRPLPPNAPHMHRCGVAPGCERNAPHFSSPLGGKLLSS